MSRTSTRLHWAIRVVIIDRVPAAFESDDLAKAWLFALESPAIPNLTLKEHCSPTSTVRLNRLPTKEDNSFDMTL
jgi:hypothetical protein